MPTSDKTVKVTLVAVSSPYVRGTTEASAATRKLGTDLDRASAKTKGLETGMGRASSAAKGFAVGAAALVGTGLVRFLNDAVSAASDLGETTSKAGQIFGQEALPALQRFADGAAEAIGASKQQALDAAATFGVFGKSAGLAGQDLVSFSTDLTTLAGDLASFGNTTTDEAITAIGAALRGESEPIRQYGVLLDDATLRQRALKLGIVDTTKNALTPQQRVLAAQAEIFAQTADAQGDFARTSDGLANQQRILAAEWENAKTELGQGLLPAVTETVKALRAGVDVAVAAGHAFGEIPGPVKAAIAALVIYKLTNERVASGIGSARDAIRRMREELALQQALAGGISGGYQRLGDEAQVAGGKVSRTAGALALAGKAAKGTGSALLGAFGGPVGLAVIGLTAAVGAFAQKHQEAQQRVEEFTAAIKADSGALKENTREAAANALEKSGASKAAKELGVNLNDLTSAALGNADAQERVNDALARAELAANTTTNSYGEFAAAGQQFTMNAGKVRDAIGGTNKELADARAEYERHVEMVGTDASAQSDLTSQTKDTTSSLEDQNKAVQDLAKKVLDLADAHQSAVDAEIGYQQALDDVNAAIKENGKTATKNGKELDLTTQKGRDNAKALLDQATEAKRVAQANLEGGDSLKSLRENMAKAREEFIANAQKMGLSKDAAEKMADEFGLTKGQVDNLAKSVDDLPASKQIKIEAETAAAEAELARLKTVLDGLKSKTVVIDTVTRQRYVNEQGPNGSRPTSGGLTKADGGYISGPGTSRSDSIPAWLSNGEYVIQAAAVSKYGTSLLDHINAMRFADGGNVGRGAARVQYLPTPSTTINIPRGVGGEFDYDRLAAAMSRVNLSVLSDSRGYSAAEWGASQRGML